MTMRTWLLAAVLGVTGAHTAAGQPAPGNRILVVPFETTQHDARTFWLSEASAILLADALGARGLPAIGT